MKRWRWALLVIPPVVLAAGVFAVVSHERMGAPARVQASSFDEEMRMFDELDAARDEFAAAARKTPLPRLVARPVLGSASARAEAHRDLAELRRLGARFHTMHAASLEKSREREERVRLAGGKPSVAGESAALAIAQSQARWRLLLRLCDLAEASLRNADDGRAEFFATRAGDEDPDGRLVFGDRAHDDRYVELARQMNATGHELDAVRARQQKEYDAMRARQKRETGLQREKPTPSVPKISPLRNARGGIGDD